MKVKLKGDTLYIAGKAPIDAGSVTVELYEALIKENPNYAASFEVIEDAKVKVEKVKES